MIALHTLDMALFPWKRITRDQRQRDKTTVVMMKTTVSSLNLSPTFSLEMNLKATFQMYRMTSRFLSKIMSIASCPLIKKSSAKCFRPTLRQTPCRRMTLKDRQTKTLTKRQGLSQGDVFSAVDPTSRRQMEEWSGA